MSATPPPRLPNPPLILFDTDALLQLLIADEMRILRFIKRRLHIQPAIVEPVENEIRKSKKFPRFGKELQKAIDSDALTVIDPRTLPAFVTTSPHAIYDAIQTRGMEYSDRLDYGEAYTFAAGVVLTVPVVSNDLRAINTARMTGLDLPAHVLRAFDLVVLSNQIGELAEGDCDRIRQALLAEKQFLPRAFNKTSYAKGLASFYARVVDGSKAAIGAPEPLDDLDTRLELFP